MPETVEEYAARIVAAQDADGRIALGDADFLTWDIFPFEREGLRLRPGPTLAEAEAPRVGEDPATCFCARDGSRPSGGWSPLWEDDDFVVSAAPSSGSPLVVGVRTRRHLDVPDLPDDLAASFGRLQVATIAAVEALPSVQRCHMFRIGDGGAHAHWWFLARPTRMPQLRGSFMVDWDDVLPPVPLEVRDDNAAFVARRLIDRLGEGSRRG